MAVVYFRINHKGREVTIRENYILHSKLEWKLSELFCAAGLKKERRAAQDVLEPAPRKDRNGESWFKTWNKGCKQNV